MTEFKDYAELLERARFGDTPFKTRKSFQYPSWYELLLERESDPCKLVHCENRSLIHDNFGSVSRVLDIIARLLLFIGFIGALPAIFSFVLGYLITVDAVSWNINSNLLIPLPLIVFSFLFAGLYITRDLRWKFHKKDVDEELERRLQLYPGAAVYNYVIGYLEDIEWSVIGYGMSPLRDIQERLDSQFKKIKKEEKQLARRIKKGADANKNALNAALNAVHTLKMKLGAIKAQIDGQTSGIEIVYDHYKEQIKDIKVRIDDLTALEKASKHDALTKRRVRSIKQGISDSIREIFVDFEHMSRRFNDAMSGPSETLFVSSKRSDLESDIELYERLSKDAGLPLELESSDPPDEPNEEDEEEVEEE
ncbi:hypothetical protein KKE33_04210 [Patescibacteria group bacterium]|nr:hypothetical protein [Patescibacteria group bacterium]